MKYFSLVLDNLDNGLLVSLLDVDGRITQRSLSLKFVAVIVPRVNTTGGGVGTPGQRRSC